MKKDNRIDHIISCPLCNEAIEYEKSIETHLWICKACFFVGMEFYDQSNIDDLQKRLIS